MGAGQKTFADVGCDSLVLSLTFRVDLRGFKVGQVQVWISRKESRSQGFGSNRCVHTAGYAIGAHTKVETFRSESK